MKELPENLTDNFKSMSKTSESNLLKIFKTKEEQVQFIKNMENIYNRSTERHIILMEEKEHEGNVDERTWYRLWINLNKD